MKRMGWKKNLLLCALVLCLVFPGAGAYAGEADFFTLDVDRLDMNLLNSNDYVFANLSSSAQGLRVIKQVSQSSKLAEPVRLTLTQVNTHTLLMDKDYGYQSRQFDSGVIYLPYSYNQTEPYLVTLYVGNMVYAIPYMQQQPRMEFNTACTYGVRLRDLDGRITGDWMMGTMLDLNQLRSSGVQYVNLCASNLYVVGQAAITMQDGSISVQPLFLSNANVEVQGLSVYLITECAGLSSDPAAAGFPAYAAGEWIPVDGAESALLYMPMSISYDPAGLSSFYYNLSDMWMQEQLALWNANQNRWAAWTEAEPSGEEDWQEEVWTEEPSYDEGDGVYLPEEYPAEDFAPAYPEEENFDWESVPEDMGNG